MSTNTNIKNIYNLSPMQEGMLFHSILNKESNAYFESLIIDICGELDIDIFEKSFNILIERYDILRTVFVHHNLNKPKQIVFKERTSKICFEDISTLEEDKKKI